jgi:hypothetical protein
VVNIRQAMATPGPIKIAKPTLPSSATFEKIQVKPFHHYRTILERDLFGTKRNKAQAPQKPKEIEPKMGLRNGHVITGVNDQEIMGPDQAAEFFRTLAEGGDITIKVRKSRGVRKRSRSIRLNIE